MPNVDERTAPTDTKLRDLAIGGAVGLAIVAVHQLSGGRIGLPCLLRTTTGLDCPFCGATRMAGALLSGDLGAALHYNAPVLVVGVVVGVLWVIWVLQRLRGVTAPRPRFGRTTRRRLLIAGVVLAVVFMVLRNLPWAPFTSLYV